MNGNDELGRELAQILRDARTMPLSDEEILVLCYATGVPSADVLPLREQATVPPTPQEWYDHLHDDSPW